MKPDQFATTVRRRKLFEVAVVNRGQELVPEVLSVMRGMIELQRCWRPLDRDEPRGRICVLLVDQEVLNGVDSGCIES
jgi:hypothetical protein